MKIHCAHDAEVALADLKPNPANPNKHPDSQIALLAKIIKAQGWRNPIVVSNRSGLITKGHGRLAAALTLGATHAPVDYQDYASEKEELADMIADNRIAELAEADRSMLRELAEQLDDGSFDMDLTGFDHDALEELMTAAPPESDIDAEPQIDKAEELRVKWGVERGQIWELGDHRIMCGDCTTDTGQLLNGDKVAMIFTDPPYGVGFKYRSYDDSKGKDHHAEFSAKWWAVAKSLTEFIVVTPGFDNEVIFFKLEPTLSQLVWHKQFGMSASRVAFARITEPIFVHGKPPVRRYDTDFFSVGTDREKDLHEKHPCPKPTALVVALIAPQTKSGAIVADLFGGAGTTIIACEQLGRKCLAMEIDPGYVAVSIQRWADATGKTPKLLTSFPNKGKDSKISKSRKKA